MALLEWIFAITGEEPLERVELDDDGTARRFVSRAAGQEPEIGWWRGALDPGQTAAARSLIDRPWSAPATGSRPAAGGWSVRHGEDELALWGSQYGENGSASADAPPADQPEASQPDASGDLRGQLLALLGACVDAASEATRAVRASSYWAAVLEERFPMLKLTAIGSDPCSLTLEARSGGGDAAFMTEDGSTWGFMGGNLELTPGLEIFALLRGAEPSDGVLEFGAYFAGEDAMRTGGALSIAVGEQADDADDV